MKRLLLDQGVPRDAGVILREAGWDVVHVGEVGLAAAEDDHILEWARAESRVCVTLDGDFHASLALSGGVAPSVVRVRMESVRGEQMARILVAVWEQHEAGLDRGSLVTVTKRKVRIHPLPIRQR